MKIFFKVLVMALLLQISAQAEDKPCTSPIPKTRLVAGTVVTFPSSTVDEANYKYRIFDEQAGGGVLINLFREENCTTLLFTVDDKLIHHINLQVGEPTAEDLMKLVNDSIKFSEWQLATLKRLMGWYQVDRQHPSAIALKEEYGVVPWGETNS